MTKYQVWRSTYSELSYYKWAFHYIFNRTYNQIHPGNVQFKILFSAKSLKDSRKLLFIWEWYSYARESSRLAVWMLKLVKPFLPLLSVCHLGYWKRVLRNFCEVSLKIEHLMNYFNRYRLMTSCHNTWKLIITVQQGPTLVIGVKNRENSCPLLAHVATGEVGWDSSATTRRVQTIRRAFWRMPNIFGEQPD